MFSFFITATEESKKEDLTYNTDTKACLELFVPGPIIQLYNQMKDYIAQNGKKPPEYPSIYAWTGMAKTNQHIATSVISLIEEHLSYDLNELLKLKEQEHYKLSNENKHFLRPSYQIARRLHGILERMPTENIVTFFTNGSEVRKAITDTLNYYTNALREKNFPTDLDINKENGTLSNFLKCVV